MSPPIEPCVDYKRSEGIIPTDEKDPKQGNPGANMRRRHRRSAQLTFVMEFPAGEPSSCSPSNSGSLWSQIHNRPSPQSHLPPSSGPGFAAALLASAENGLSLSMAPAQQSAVVSGQQMPALQPGSGPTNRVLIVCRHWFVSVTRHCTRCMPRQQRVYGLSPQDPRFTGANAPRTSSGARGGQDPALQTAITASVLEESRQQQIRYIRSRAVQDVETIGADGRITSDNVDNTSALEAGHQIQHPLDNSGGSGYSGQQRHEYRFSGASAPVPPGYEHHQGSSNSDSPPYLPSREHHQSAGGGWSGHTAKYHLNNPQQDRPV